MTSPEEELTQLRRLLMVVNTDLEQARRELRDAERRADRYRGNDQGEIRRLEAQVTLLNRKVDDGDKNVARLNREMANVQKKIDKGK